MLIAEFQNGLFVLDTILNEPILVLLEGNGAQKFIDFRIGAVSAARMRMA